VKPFHTNTHVKDTVVYHDATFLINGNGNNRLLVRTLCYLPDEGPCTIFGEVLLHRGWTSVFDDTRSSHPSLESIRSSSSTTEIIEAFKKVDESLLASLKLAVPGIVPLITSGLVE
jgi:hypothetical protein